MHAAVIELDALAPIPSVTLAEGSMTVGVGEMAFFQVTQPGMLTGSVNWAGPSVTMDAGFVHEGALLDLATGGSSLTVSQAVTDALVAGGTSWGFYISNAGADVTVTYIVVFTPD